MDSSENIVLVEKNKSLESEKARLEQRILELEADISHAILEAKKYSPDYPWSPEGKDTASVAVWALGQSAIGIEQGLNDRIEVIEARLKAQEAVIDAIGPFTKIMRSDLGCSTWAAIEWRCKLELALKALDNHKEMRP